MQHTVEQGLQAAGYLRPLKSTMVLSEGRK